MSIESNESLNIEIVNNFFTKSSQTYLSLIQFIKQYSEISREYLKKMKSLHGKFVPKLKNTNPNANDNLFFLLTGRLLKVIEAQTDTAQDLLVDIESAADKAKQFADELTESNKKFKADYMDSVKDLTNKYKEIEKVKKEFLTDASNAENYLIKMKIVKKHGIGEINQNPNVIVNSDEHKTNEEHMVHTEKDNSQEILNKMRVSESNYKHSMKSVKNFEDSYKSRAAAAINSSISTNLEFAKEIKGKISSMLIYLKNIAQMQLTEADTYLQEIDKFTIEQRYEEIIRQSMISDKPLKITEQEPYHIKLLQEYNAHKAVDNKDLSEEDVADVIKTISDNLRVKKKENFDLNEEKKRFDLIRISKKFLTSDPMPDVPQDDIEHLKAILNEMKYRVEFLQNLNDLRVKGVFIIPEKNFNIISDILYLCLNTVFRDNDFYSGKNVIILSQTFYYLDNGKKIYLNKKLFRHPTIKEDRFWSELINYSITQEANNLKNSDKLKDESTSHFHLSNLVFSQLLPLSDNMLEFGLREEKIKDIITPFIKQYNLDKALEESIYGVLNRPSRLIDPSDYEEEESKEEGKSTIQRKTNSSKNNEVSNNSNVDIEEKENKDDSNLSKNNISNGSSL